MLREELQLARAVRLLQGLQEAPSEQAREHAHRQEEARSARHPTLAVHREPAAGHDAVHVRVVRERRTPGVQHQGGADLRLMYLGSAVLVLSV